MSDFHAHLDRCEHCRTNVFNLCPTGYATLHADAALAVSIEREVATERTYFVFPSEPVKSELPASILEYQKILLGRKMERLEILLDRKVREAERANQNRGPMQVATDTHNSPSS